MDTVTSTNEKPQTIVEALSYWAKVIPNKNAFCFINNRGECTTSISFKELHELAIQFSKTQLVNTKHGDRVAIILPTGPEFVIAFLGSLYAQTIPVPLSQPTRQHGTENIRHIISDAKPTTCITTDLLLDTLSTELDVDITQNSIHIFSFNYNELCLEKNKIHVSPGLKKSPSFPHDKDIAFLQYTSGSTSKPKGVMVSHKNIYSNHKMIREVFGHDKKTRQLNWMPLYHDMGLIGHVLHPICNGHTSFLMDPFVFVQRPRIWLESISRYKITSTGGPNFCYQHCVKRIKPHSISSLDLSSLRVAYNGAEPINPDVIEDFNNLCKPLGFNKNTFLPCFGLAEATLLVSGIRHNGPLSFLAVNKNDLHNRLSSLKKLELYHSKSSLQDTVSFPSLGRPADGIDIKIINPETKKTNNPFLVGEVCLFGDNITQGYWHNEEATLKTFITLDGKTYLRTGDLGFLSESNELFITGRLKDLIIIDGKNHYPQDIEFTTQAVDHLLKENACAVFTLDDNQCVQNVNQLIVIQELDRHYKNSADTQKLLSIKENIKRSISQHHSLAVNNIVLIDCNTMPKTTSGKIKRHHAKYLYENHLLKEVHEN
ncbi:MAG: fatty acyl-AMP ligase [Cellvibrionaceae bacterium]